MNISWSLDARSGANFENPLLKKEEAQTFLIFFRFSISVHNLLLVLYSMFVISHWLTIVAIYVILSKINVTNKVGQLGQCWTWVFIYNKTSPGKGGMIGTVYHNYHCPALIITFIFPDLLPKILLTSSQEHACPTRTYACLIKHYSNSQ